MKEPDPRALELVGHGGEESNLPEQNR